MPKLYHKLADESWESLAEMALSFKAELEEIDTESKRLQKEIGMLRHLLHEYLKNPEENEHILKSANFYVKAYKTLNRLESLFEKRKAKRTDFIHFLQAIVEKLRKEKLVAVKVEEIKKEFSKLKPLPEEEKNASLRKSKKDRNKK